MLHPLQLLQGIWLLPHNNYKWHTYHLRLLILKGVELGLEVCDCADRGLAL
ncbi:hypothetical protein RchiOBHm_Chr2g0085871 [Rosa chinensis]|uniref:Uncharacterized protein n=1 Tax=Rosa chinensis TaxID=74649 RepID=A0A2P6RI79_ROSCH|nr:hypothetical protein RchiOBHm_Chr2g0085871 [Rosa chinensis]